MLREIDPNLVFDLRAKLDAAGYEVGRVAAVVMNPKATQGELVAAIEPVADRLLKRFAAAKAAWTAAVVDEDEKVAKTSRTR